MSTKDPHRYKTVAEFFDKHPEELEKEKEKLIREINPPLIYQREKRRTQENEEMIRAHLTELIQGEESTRPGIILVGKPGSGKTMFAYDIAKWCIEHFWFTIPALRSKQSIPLFVRYQEFVENARWYMQRYGNNESDKVSSSERFIENMLSHPGPLFFDDIGAVRSNPAAVELLYKIIDERLSSLRPVIVTTNNSLKDIAVELDERIAHRLLRWGTVYEVKDNVWTIKQ